MSEDAAAAGNELVARVRAGDDGALTTLLHCHQARLLAHIRMRLHPGLASKVDPDDVLGDVYVVVSRRLAEFRGKTEAEFVAWLTHISDFKVKETNRHYLDTGRRDARMERPPGTRPNDSRIPGLGPTPSEEAMGMELVAKAQRAFERLSPDDQTVLQLMRVVGTDLHAVARQMNRSYDATKKLHGRAMGRYREQLMGSPGG